MFDLIVNHSQTGKNAIIFADSHTGLIVADSIKSNLSTKGAQHVVNIHLQGKNVFIISIAICSIKN